MAKRARDKEDSQEGYEQTEKDTTTQVPRPDLLETTNVFITPCLFSGLETTVTTGVLLGSSPLTPLRFFDFFFFQKTGETFPTPIRMCRLLSTRSRTSLTGIPNGDPTKLLGLVQRELKRQPVSWILLQ